MNFKTLYEAGAVKRYHTNLTIKEQDLAAHQWGVALIVNHIHPMGYNVLMAALTHDLAESVTGDIPYTAKQKFTPLRAVSDACEEAFNRDHGIDYPLNKEEQHILHWADMFECFLFSRREAWMGNYHMKSVMITARDALIKMGHPNDKAAQLFKEYHE